MNGKEALEALLVELDKRKRSRIHRTFDEDSLADLIRSALDPKPFFRGRTSTSAFRPPVIPPEFPKLKVRHERHTGKILEWIVLENAYSENPFRDMTDGWYRADMSILEKLKSDGVPERLLTQWERAQRDAAPKEIKN